MSFFKSAAEKAAKHESLLAEVGAPDELMLDHARNAGGIDVFVTDRGVRAVMKAGSSFKHNAFWPWSQVQAVEARGMGSIQTLTVQTANKSFEWKMVTADATRLRSSIQARMV